MRTIQDVLAIADSTKFAISLSELVNAREGSVGYDGLSQPEQIALCVDGLEREVNNGGFEQYFFNSAGDHAHDCLDALEEIGALLMAKLLRKALAIFGPAGPDPDREERGLQLEALGDRVAPKLEPLDDAFFDYPDDLASLLRTFVEANASAFSPAPEL
jgi:hypothetical protein